MIEVGTHLGDRSSASIYSAEAIDQAEKIGRESEAYAVIAAALARSGRYVKARRVANRCNRPQDALKAYAAILRAYTASNR
jgi:hypothetical protein